MQAYQRQTAVKNRSGSALLGLVAVVGLVLIVLIGQWWMKKTTKDPDLHHELTPWKEWKLREARRTEVAQASETDVAVTESTEEQADISEGLVFETGVDYNEQSRGDIRITILPDGRITGGWSGSYYDAKKINYDLQGSGFSGYICPLKVYQDEDGEEDLTKLYFIGKGEFVYHKTDLKNTYRIEGGDLYVKGWLNTDETISGELIITSNEKYSETYEWSAHRQASRVNFGF